MDIELWTDGSCLGNPGPGGYAAFLRAPLPGGKWHELAVVGGSANTTNNEMEMQAVLAGLQAITKPGCSITVYTDSQLVVGYLAKGYKAKATHLRAIRDQIQALVKEKSLTMTYVKVNGHSNVKHNELVDKLAVQQAERQKGALS